MMKRHIETMIRDVPLVRALAPWYGVKHRDNTLDEKRFDNSKMLWCLGGKAARNYREKSPDEVIYDELSKFDADIEGEGSPTMLGDKRLDLDDTGVKDGKNGKGKGKSGGRGARSPGRGIGAGMKGPAILGVIEAGFKVKDTYENAETQDEKAEGYGAAAGGLAGTLAGAAAGAFIGSAVPVIGTVLGGVIGGWLGSMGGDALGGTIGKSMFGSDESTKAMPVAGPLMMRDAGKDMPPVLGDIAKSFEPARTGPLMMASPGQGVLSAAPGAVNSGDAARSMMLPPASADAAVGPLAAPLAAAVVAKVHPAKVDAKIDINAALTVTVQGDVKDPAELVAQLRPLMEQQQREIAQQLENRKLYDAPHI